MGGGQHLKVNIFCRVNYFLAGLTLFLSGRLVLKSRARLFKTNDIVS